MDDEKEPSASIHPPAMASGTSRDDVPSETEGLDRQVGSHAEAGTQSPEARVAEVELLGCSNQPTSVECRRAAQFQKENARGAILLTGLVLIWVV